MKTPRYDLKKNIYKYIDVGIEGIFCLFRLMNGQQIISGMH